jgi:hypothetical protein
MLILHPFGSHHRLHYPFQVSNAPAAVFCCNAAIFERKCHIEGSVQGLPENKAGERLMQKLADAVKDKPPATSETNTNE